MSVLMTPAQVAERLGISRASLYRLIASGSFPPAVRLGPRTVRWRYEAIEAFIAAREDKARAA